MFHLRIVKTKIFHAGCFLLATIAMIPTALIFFYLIREGIFRLDLDFFMQNQPSPGEDNGGALNAIVGTLFLITTSTLIATPISILSAIYLTFTKKRKINEWIEVSANILQSVPAIIVGLIVYTWIASIIDPTKAFSMTSGTIALSIMMIPYITINITEVMRLIPYTIIEAAYSMGGSFSSVAFHIIIPSAMPGITTGVIVALARIAGEAAPLVLTAFGNPFVSFHPMEPTASLPLLIYNFAISPFENWRQIAWTASLLLVLLIFVLNILAETLSKKSKN